MSSGELTELFRSSGLSEQKALETTKNDNLSKRFKAVLDEASKCGLISEHGLLYYHLASKLKPVLEKHIPFLVRYIFEGKLDNTPRIDAALQYLISELKSDIDVKTFEEFCGIGVVISGEEIEQIIEDVIEEHRNEIVEKRYKFNTGTILQEVRNKLKWADGKIVKTEVDLQVSFVSFSSKIKDLTKK